MKKFDVQVRKVKDFDVRVIKMKKRWTPPEGQIFWNGVGWEVYRYVTENFQPKDFLPPGHPGLFPNKFLYDTPLKFFGAALNMAHLGEKVRSIYLRSESGRKVDSRKEFSSWLDKFKENRALELIRKGEFFDFQVKEIEDIYGPILDFDGKTEDDLDSFFKRNQPEVFHKFYKKFQENISHAAKVLDTKPQDLFREFKKENSWVSSQGLNSELGQKPKDLKNRLVHKGSLKSLIFWRFLSSNHDFVNWLHRDKGFQIYHYYRNWEPFETVGTFSLQEPPWKEKGKKDREVIKKKLDLSLDSFTVGEILNGVNTAFNHFFKVKYELKNPQVVFWSGFDLDDYRKMIESLAKEEKEKFYTDIFKYLDKNVRGSMSYSEAVRKLHTLVTGPLGWTIDALKESARFNSGIEKKELLNKKVDQALVEAIYKSLEKATHEGKLYETSWGTLIDEFFKNFTDGVKDL